MRTLSVKLPDALDAKLTAAARRRNTTRSSVVRKALEAALRDDRKPRHDSALDLARTLVGCIEGPSDLSINKAYFKPFGR
jgi:metal-responsive CopG/Arc/MetJ family transcriptional regulator